jgi:hypothetical protein
MGPNQGRARIGSGCWLCTLSFTRMNCPAMLIKSPLQLVRVLFPVGTMACWRYAEQRFGPAGYAAGLYRNFPQPFGHAQERLLHAS